MTRGASTSQRVERRAAGFAGVVLVATLLPLTGAAGAQGDDALDLEGSTPVEYAIAWSQQAYPPADLDAGQGPDWALIGRDDIFADSLSSAALQDDAVLLLTPSDTLSEQTVAELERLGVSRATVLGGEQAISSGVEDQLTQMGLDVDRLWGATRTETAIAVAEHNGSDTALLLRSTAVDGPTQEFVDSLASGGWAAEANFDVLLTRTEELTQTTADHLAAAGYQRVIIVGGPAAVSPAVENAVEALVPDVDRVAGPTRFETAVAIAKARGFETSPSADVTLLVDGQSADAWADGLAAAHLSARGYPIVLAASAEKDLPEATGDFLVPEDNRLKTHLDDVDLICGSSVPDGDSAGEPDQCAEAAELMGLRVVTVPLLGDFTVTIEPANVEQGGDVTITVGGLAEGDEVVITDCGLNSTHTVTAEDIDEEGNVTFVQTVPGDQPPGDCDISITVNGEEIGSFQITVVAASGGALPAQLEQIHSEESNQLSSGHVVEIGGTWYLVTADGAGTYDEIYVGTWEHDGVILFNINGSQGSIPDSANLTAAVSRDVAETVIDNLTQTGSGPAVDWQAVFTERGINGSNVCALEILLFINADQGGLLPGFDGNGQLDGNQVAPGDAIPKSGGTCPNDPFPISLDGHHGT